MVDHSFVLNRIERTSRIDKSSTNGKHLQPATQDLHLQTEKPIRIFKFYRIKLHNLNYLPIPQSEEALQEVIEINQDIAEKGHNLF